MFSLKVFLSCHLVVSRSRGDRLCSNWGKVDCGDPTNSPEVMYCHQVDSNWKKSCQIRVQLTEVQCHSCFIGPSVIQSSFLIQIGMTRSISLLELGETFVSAASVSPSWLDFTTNGQGQFTPE